MGEEMGVGAETGRTYGEKQVWMVRGVDYIHAAGNRWAAAVVDCPQSLLNY